MTSSRQPIRSMLIRVLLGLLLMTPAAAIAQFSAGGGQSPPQSTLSQSDCLAGDGGDPGANPCAGAGPASQEDDSGVEHGAGNPIDVLTGNKYQRETDLPALPGVLGIEIVRHYNSAQAGTDAPLGLLGRGWRLSYETDLYALEHELHIVQADGRRHVFTRDPKAQDRYTSADPARGWVTSTASASLEGRMRYRWTWPDGRTLDFDARGKLVQIRVPSGEFLSLTRGPRGELMKVTDPQGRSLSFEYAPRDRAGFRGVVAITSPLGRFSYAHQNDHGRPGLSNLVGVTHPDGGLRRYHYGADDGEGAPAWPHHLTGVSLVDAAPDGRPEHAPQQERLSTYAYDHQGRAVMSVRGAPRRVDGSGKTLPGTGIEQVDLDFPTPGRTVLTNALGQRTTYRHALVGGQPRLLEIIGPGCASCGETRLRYAYDTLGRTIAITRLDLAAKALATTTIERDAAGRVQRESLRRHADGKPSPVRQIVRYEYAGDSPRPALVARPSVVPGREVQRRYTYNEAGQLARITETGFSPLDASGEPIGSASDATPIERSTTFTYTRINGRSLLAAIDGPLPNGPQASPLDSDITTLEWDGQGNHPVAVTQPGGRRSTLEHATATGLLQAVTNHEGYATRFSYDLHQRVVTVRSHGPGGTRQQERQIRYDALGRPVESLDPARPASNWLRAWDERGRLLWHASALGVLDRFSYDNEGRLIEHGRRSASFDRTHWRRYDHEGRVEAVLDNAGRGRQWHRDTHGRLQYAVDADGLVHPGPAALAPRTRSQPLPPAPRTLHDDFGRAVWKQDADRGAEVREYNAGDRLIAMQDARGNRARYEYDVRGRIHRQSITDARSGTVEETRWHYTGDRLSEILHPTQRERYEYDANGFRSARIVTLPTAQGELTTVTRYEHDDSGRLIATTLPDGSRLRYERNGQGQVVALKRETAGTPWLPWMSSDRLIAGEFERDLAGLRGYVSGNGIQTLLQRSPEGVLARIVHRHHRPETSRSASRSLLEHRYVWDGRGNLLHSRQHATGGGAQPGLTSHAYDRGNRLLASVRWRTRSDTVAEQSVWRFAYDPAQRRVLAQQDVASQDELHAGTRRAAFEPGSHRQSPTADRLVRHDAGGQPERIGEREYTWDARGRLVEVRVRGATLARYGYDHRGLRNTRQTAGGTIHTIYDEHRQPLAELDTNGRILRQYIWLADLPLAVIDTPQGIAPAKADSTPMSDFMNEIGKLLRASFTEDEAIAWLHANHLGAPELATGADGRVLWRATYAPFGAAKIESQGFTLNLRLPGQHFDPETGLHYNRARYYDPELGQYLTPDPLGTPDGPNPYAYVAFNPLRYVDPDGLVLFAFDGTGNSDDRNDPAMAGSGFSNVVNFLRAYEDGNRRYVSGVGTVHRDIEYGDIRPEDYASRTLLWWLTPGDPTYINDMGGNYSGPARIARMMLYLRDEADQLEDDEVLDIDIIGFSRGGAQARDFANRIVADAADYEGATYYSYTKKDGTPGCQPVNFRFMGLFDTVLSTNMSGTGYRLGIPDNFTYVAQAIALNEHRSDSLQEFGYRNPKPHSMHWGGFPLESIGASSDEPGQIRVEKGFIGAHADIGGGYPDDEQGLSLVALNWMVEQARLAGVSMKSIDPIPAHEVVLHDQSNVIQAGNPQNVVPRQMTQGDLPWIDYVFPEDRSVNGAIAGDRQRNMGFDNGSLTHADTHQFITWRARDIDQLGTGSTLDPRELDNVTGTVDMRQYVKWLCANAYFDKNAPQCAS
ncbi:Protein RhsC [Thauera sp. GDN1]|nr:Protein RhsC [Thauera sp. GDN1]